jgi:hypothetical protein
MSSTQFDIYLNNKKIDSVYYTDYTREEVKKTLIDHDNYDPNIVVKIPRCDFNRKYNIIYVLQGRYGQVFEDLTAETTLKEIKQRKKEYLANDTWLKDYRIIKRRELNK